MNRPTTLARWILPAAMAAFALQSAAAGGQQAVAAPPSKSTSGFELAALDRSADPCTDFYQFTCGGWVKSHPLPADHPIYGRFDELQERNNEILHRILDQAASKAADA